MRRDVTKPVDAAGFHGGAWVEALGDGAGNQGLALLRQQFQQARFLGNQAVDPSGPLVKEVGDAPLTIQFRENYSNGGEFIAR